MVYKVVKNYNDANTLLELGFNLIKIDRNRNDRTKLVFMFEEDSRIDEILKTISLVKKK